MEINLTILKEKRKLAKVNRHSTKKYDDDIRALEAKIGYS